MKQLKNIFENKSAKEKIYVAAIDQFPVTKKTETKVNAGKTLNSKI